jgi:hypothetical protein
LSASSSGRDDTSDHNSRYLIRWYRKHQRTGMLWAPGITARVLAHRTVSSFLPVVIGQLVLFGSGAQPAQSYVRRRWCGDMRHLQSTWRSGWWEVMLSLARIHRIQPHTAGTNIRLTAHLGLVIPNNKDACRIRVRDTWCQWGLVRCSFDDSYEHEVRNDSNECRAILLMRFWHPNLAVPRNDEVLAQALQCKEDDGLRAGQHAAAGHLLTMLATAVVAAE